ncbi:glyoxalase-like protein [Silicimonas algicola]|uniref:Glyoxalase-like protein n=2 Tax=Silicimonas algicola TaxID=1826607 RepID=A0A316GDC6_9RHOB|nr:glyoxalase-like protein [Silicimonas algicola]
MNFSCETGGSRVIEFAMRFHLALDHVAVVARTLDEGTAYVEAVLGAKLSTGGKHPDMGTHNRLLSLGDRTYLEVIAVDPEASRPSHRRWFNLDSFSAAPRMTNWICRTDHLDNALAAAPAGSGTVAKMSRGDIHWWMGVTEFGRLPFDDAMPALIEWPEGFHPAKRLPDHGFRLTRLDVFHPEADKLLAAFPALHSVDRVSLREGPEKRLIATIATPEGNRILA